MDEEEGNFPDEFHGAKITSVDEERLKWPGSVEISVRRVFLENRNISTSKDTQLVLVYNDPEEDSHSVFVTGVAKIANEPHFGIVNSWGTPQAGDPTHVKVAQDGNVVYEVRARWTPDCLGLLRF